MYLQEHLWKFRKKYFVVELLKQNAENSEFLYLTISLELANVWQNYFVIRRVEL